MGRVREDVEFTSHGATLRGWLYRAEGPGPAPAVVMAHGLSAVKEMYLDRYAEVFAEAGFTTLAYDHFGFGSSDGQPRQYPSQHIQLLGYRDAVVWMSRRREVDPTRIGLWGSSYSGGEVIVLASEDSVIRCAVAQVPGLGVGTPEPSPETIALILRAIEDGDDGQVVPAVARHVGDLGVMFADHAYDWFTRVASQRAPNWRNELRVRALADAVAPLDFIADAKVPLLMIVAPEDRLTPPGPATALAESTSNVVVAEIAGGHFDAYEDGFEVSSQLALGWFARHLA